VKTHAEGASRAVEWAARSAYGRLVATLTARSRDLQAAEDALSDAFAAALQQWPSTGVPSHPDAWLLAVARRRLLDRQRHEAVRQKVQPELEYAATLLEGSDPLEAPALPDRRAALLFACAHPALDESLHAPIMLQAVLGLEAEQVAAAFLVKPATMAQRLVRAKRKLRDSGIPFALPEPHDLPHRVAPVLDAIYAAFGTAWDAVSGGDSHRASLADEAIWLARVVVEALPQDAEAMGLLSLMRYSAARTAARTSHTGEYVPLREQDPARWDQAAIDEAEQLLQRASALRSPGRYQTEAAIQSLHIARQRGVPVPADALLELYNALWHFAPTIGVLVNRAMVLAAARGPAQGLALLDEVPDDLRSAYQPWWALRAQLLTDTGRTPDAQLAYDRAIGLTVSPAVRHFLLSRRAQLASPHMQS